MDMVVRVSLFYLMDMYFIELTNFPPNQKSGLVNNTRCLPSYETSTLETGNNFTLNSNENSDSSVDKNENSALFTDESLNLFTYQNSTLAENENSTLLTNAVAMVTDECENSMDLNTCFHILFALILMLLASSPSSSARSILAFLTLSILTYIPLIFIPCILYLNLFEVNIYLLQFLRLTFYSIICFRISLRIYLKIEEENRPPFELLSLLSYLLLSLSPLRSIQIDVAKYLSSAFFLSLSAKNISFQTLWGEKRTQNLLTLLSFLLIHTVPIIYKERVVSGGDLDHLVQFVRSKFLEEEFSIYRVLAVFLPLGWLTSGLHCATARILFRKEEYHSRPSMFLVSPVFFLVFSIDKSFLSLQPEKRWNLAQVYLQMYLVSVLVNSCDVVSCALTETPEEESWESKHWLHYKALLLSLVNFVSAFSIMCCWLSNDTTFSFDTCIVVILTVYTITVTLIHVTLSFIFLTNVLYYSENVVLQLVYATMYVHFSKIAEFLSKSLMFYCVGWCMILSLTYSLVFDLLTMVGAFYCFFRIGCKFRINFAIIKRVMKIRKYLYGRHVARCVSKSMMIECLLVRCRVCKDVVETYRGVTRCNHYYHVDCLFSRLLTTDMCKLCHYNLFTNKFIEPT